jgi:hypothetical protein
MALHHFIHFDTARLVPSWSPVVLLVTACALSLVLLSLRRVLYPIYDPREPPVVHSKIPIAGHSLSILKEGGAYYQRV